MGELGERDSLDLGMSSASLPPLCSGEFDELLKFFVPNAQQQSQLRSRNDGHVEGQTTTAQFALLAPAQVGQGQQFLTLQASPASQAMPVPRQVASYTPSSGNEGPDSFFGEKLVPPRRASWAGPIGTAAMGSQNVNRIAQTLASLPPFAQCKTSEATVLPTPTPFARPPSKDGPCNSNGTGGSPALSVPFSQSSTLHRSNSNGHSGSGASNCTPGDETMAENEPAEKPFSGGLISITQDAQMFISGAPFVFQGTGIKEEGGSCHISLSPRGVGSESLDHPENTAQRRVEARKERNRRAQRTFRQRQKHKMMDLEAELAELIKRRDALKAQNLNLNANVSLLTKVLEVRERQVLEMNRKEDEVSNIHVDDSALFQTLNASRRAPRFLSAWIEDGKPAEITVDFICQLTPERIYRIYVAYGQDICEGVKMLDAGTTDMKKLTQLTRELTHVLVLFFNRKIDYYNSAREIAERPMPPNYSLMDVMKNATGGIKFDLQQKQFIAKKWKWLQQENACYEEELSAVQAELSAVLPSEIITGPIYQELREANNRVGRIERLRHALHEAKMQYVYYTCQTMTPEQIARTVASCFPVIPNIIILGEVLARELDEVNRSASTCQEIEAPPCYTPSQHGRDLMPGPPMGDDITCLTANCSQEIPSPICDDFNGQFVPT